MPVSSSQRSELSLSAATTAQLPLSSVDQVTHRLFHSKNLDLMLLAGCSCLLTLLVHPVAETLSHSQAAAKSMVESSVILSTTTPTVQTDETYPELPSQKRL